MKIALAMSLPIHELVEYLAEELFADIIAQLVYRTILS